MSLHDKLVALADQLEMTMDERADMRKLAIAAASMALDEARFGACTQLVNGERCYLMTGKDCYEAIKAIRDELGEP